MGGRGESDTTSKRDDRQLDSGTFLDLEQRVRPGRYKAERVEEALQKTINTPDKENAWYMAGLMLSMNDADPDFAALKIGDFLLGGGTLSSRHSMHIRWERKQERPVQ